MRTTLNKKFSRVQIGGSIKDQRQNYSFKYSLTVHETRPDLCAVSPIKIRAKS